MDRVAQLNRLLDMAEAVDLSEFPWDAPASLVELRAEHLAGALSKFLNGRASASEIEKWANRVESREDVNYDSDSIVGMTLHELANPYLTQPLSKQRALEIIGSLNCAAG